MKKRFVVLACFDVAKQKGLIVSGVVNDDIFRLYGDAPLGFTEQSLWLNNQNRLVQAGDEIEVEISTIQQEDPEVPERLDIDLEVPIQLKRSRSMKWFSKHLESIAFRFRRSWITASPTKAIHTDFLKREGLSITLAAIQCNSITCAIGKNSRGKRRPYLSFEHSGNSFTLPYLISTDPDFTEISKGTIFLIVGIGEAFWGSLRYKLVYGLIHDKSQRKNAFTHMGLSLEEWKDLDAWLESLPEDWSQLDAK